MQEPISFRALKKENLLALKLSRLSPVMLLLSSTAFLISSEVLQKSLLREQEEKESTSNDTSTRRFGMPTTNKTEPEQEPEKPKASPNKVYLSTDDAIEQLPEFPGGMQAFMSHISKSIRYPWICKERKNTG